MSTPFPTEPAADLKAVIAMNPLVNRAFKQGLSMEQCIIAMADCADSMRREITRLESISPKIARDAEGALLRWDCPTELLGAKLSGDVMGVPVEMEVSEQRTKDGTTIKITAPQTPMRFEKGKLSVWPPNW